MMVVAIRNVEKCVFTDCTFSQNIEGFLPRDEIPEHTGNKEHPRHS